MVRALVGSFVTLILVGGTLAASPASGAPDRGQAPSHEVREGHDRIVRYWTAQRMRNAIPRELGAGAQPNHHRPDHAGGPPGSGGDDGGDGGGDGGSTTVTGAPWPEDGSQEGMAGETTLKVYFTLDGVDYVCSGSTVTSPSGDSVALTAGHCVHDGDGRADSWATFFLVVPAFEDGGSNCPSTTYGCWTAEVLTTTKDWFDTGDFADDAGFANLRDGGHEAKNLVDVVGSQAISFAGELLNPTDVHAFGYPAAKKYSGRDLIYCAGTTRDGVFAGTAGLNCDMTGGSSGGPWLASFDTQTAAGTAVSVNSHGFRTIKDVMFGPVFGSDEQDAYDAAYDGSGHGL